MVWVLDGDGGRCTTTGGEEPVLNMAGRCCEEAGSERGDQGGSCVSDTKKQSRICVIHATLGAVLVFTIYRITCLASQGESKQILNRIIQ